MTSKRPGVAIAHPLQQHSYRLSNAIEGCGRLLRYYTTVYYRGQRPLYRLLERILPRGTATRMRGRSSTVFGHRVRQFHELIGLVYLFVIRLDHKKLVEPLLYGILTRSFGRRVAKDVQRDADVSVLIMYDTAAFDCFVNLDRHRPEVIRVLDMSSAPASLIRHSLLEELGQRQQFRKSVEVKLRSYSPSRCERYMRELELAHFILVPSKFVLEALIHVGIARDKLLLCPYGVEASPVKGGHMEVRPNAGPMKFLFVGRVEAAKGLFYLLDAFLRFQSNVCSLTVVGSIECEPADLTPYRGVVAFAGPLAREDVWRAYEDADVYVTASLFEGFSLTILEAMSAGLPVIASTRSGGADLIANGRDGFIVEACSTGALVEAIEWAVTHPEDIRRMGAHAAMVARDQNWAKYTDCVQRALQTILDSRGELGMK